jgi:predicted phage terminase large subunit-like protein
MSEVSEMQRTKLPKKQVLDQKMLLYQKALENPIATIRALNSMSLYHFVQYFWDVVNTQPFKGNWHIQYLCEELEKVAERVFRKEPREYDLIINVPPGTTKTMTCSVMFPAWCWTKWYKMKFICASYSSQLSLEIADHCRNIIRSDQFQEIYPDLGIRDDKDTKSNFSVIKKLGGVPYKQQRSETGGSRYTTSVGGTLIGFHGDILIVDDPINPTQAISEVELANANRWMEQTLSTRKTDKAITPTIVIMQRLHQDDPSGHILSKQKENIRHISIPGECRNFKEYIKPPELISRYVDDLLDPVRIPWKVLKDMEADLGQYGYAGQVGQNPTPPGGGMFRVDHFQMINVMPKGSEIVMTVRYWDKAGTQGGSSAFTVGVRMSILASGKFLVEDVKRGRWSTDERENIIKSTAQADGPRVRVWIEQEPGSGGKESAQATILNLAGFSIYAERPTGDKIFRADPYSVQVNNDNFMIFNGMWNREFIEEHRFFPFSTYKDQVDAAGGAFSKLVGKKIARRIT